MVAMKTFYVVGRQFIIQYFFRSVVSLPFKRRKVVPDVNALGCCVGPG